MESTAYAHGLRVLALHRHLIELLISHFRSRVGGKHLNCRCGFSAKLAFVRWIILSVGLVLHTLFSQARAIEPEIIALSLFGWHYDVKTPQAACNKLPQLFVGNAPCAPYDPGVPTFSATSFGWNGPGTFACVASPVEYRGRNLNRGGGASHARRAHTCWDLIVLAASIEMVNPLLTIVASAYLNVRRVKSGISRRAPTVRRRTMANSA